MCGLQANAAIVDELKRTIEALPLEMNAVSSVAPRLAALDAPSFAVLLKYLARDNHAFRSGHRLTRAARPASVCASMSSCIANSDAAP